MAVFVVLGAPFDSGVLILVAQIICLILIISASSVVGTSLQRAMTGRWLTRVGVASYAIFLVHLQVLQVAVPSIVDDLHISNISTAVACCGALVFPLMMMIAAGFYWLIERPFTAAAKHLSLSPRPVRGPASTI